MQKLNQVIAVEKGVKNRATSELTGLHRAASKADLFNGFSKTYAPLSESGENFPPESKRVQFEANSVLKQVAKIQGELFDITASKDYANCGAKADIVVDGVTLIEGAPSTFILFLDKRLDDLRTFVEALPTLDENEEWAEDVNSGLYKTPVTQTHKTKKNPKAIVLYPATPEHPAQTQLITEDEVVGYWNTVKQSGALPRPEKGLLLERIEKLTRAVKFALEQANSVEAEEKRVGDAIFGYLIK